MISEKYNETMTRAILTSLFDKMSENVSYNDIYCFLGCEKSPNSKYYSMDCKKDLDRLSNEYKDNFSPQYPEISITDAYNAGDYFHIIVNEGIAPTRRIIINAINQKTSLEIVERILDCENVKAKIQELKFFAKSPKNQTEENLKYDKIVLYISDANEDTLIEVFKLLEKGETLKDLSAFYDIYEEDGKYLGVGTENNSWESFSEQRTENIISFFGNIVHNYYTEKKFTGTNFVEDCYKYVIANIE